MYADRSNLLKMLWAGTDGYLPKNTTFEEVNTAIQIVMCDESYFSQTLLTIMKSNMLSDEELTAKYGGYEELSKREIEILVLICQSYTTNEIAKHTSPHDGRRPDYTPWFGLLPGTG